MTSTPVAAEDVSAGSAGLGIVHLNHDAPDRLLGKGIWHFDVTREGSIGVLGGADEPIYDDCKDPGQRIPSACPSRIDGDSQDVIRSQVRAVVPAGHSMVTGGHRLADGSHEFAAIPDLRTAARYAHPWFGPLDAAGWHAMAAFHMRLHRKQVQSILAGMSA